MKDKMPLARLLRILEVLEPVVADVDEWLDGDQTEPPTVVKSMPEERRAEIELRLLRARQALREEQSGETDDG
jgi:hypothetical protein